ncbi:hypothetical protein B0T14DRAFT_563656 [Immersiella caudata]|uniref:Uncharacterized protein n=1 Tax=Immersiella caudata TaxID=314043 RepID=A0AA40C7J3_9PEZI|nr:hypothetical protein B0T14DRAFT_563656 [Immersiella caudata]
MSLRKQRLPNDSQPAALPTANLKTITYEEIASSKPSVFIIGPKKREFTLASVLVANQFPGFKRLVNGSFKEHVYAFGYGYLEVTEPDPVGMVIDEPEESPERRVMSSRERKKWVERLGSEAVESADRMVPRPDHSQPIG